MSETELKPCFCGETPTKLHLADGVSSKYALAFGDCCNEWAVEFPTRYYLLNSDQAMWLAIKEWNKAPRGTLPTIFVP